MKKKLALIGCGYLSQTVAMALKDGNFPEYELVAVLGRNSLRTKKFADYFNCKPCTDIKAFMDSEPEFVVEAASANSVVDYSEIILEGGSHLIVLSTAAFADVALYQRAIKIAAKKNTKIYIAGGATGGFNLLQTAALMSTTPIDVTITSKKSPGFVARTPFYKDGLMDITEPERVFTGTAKKIIDIFPYVFNVVYATSLASAGPEATKFNIDATPNFTGDDYRIEVKGDNVALDLTIKSDDYAIAAWSVVSILKNAVSPVVFM
ncbi:aspartate dehydrogenase domain-containing protein [Psychromonas arctica]|uniref:aspartate dehydrogenase domain-containing protein n=1 Tax=Psychromonas arctica TaxID=168275 RepID=UPI00040879A9|nr:aspartate dehydrogenase domain-containing protein [Psychromonas arctica]